MSMLLDTTLYILMEALALGDSCFPPFLSNSKTQKRVLFCPLVYLGVIHILPSHIPHLTHTLLNLNYTPVSHTMASSSESAIPVVLVGKDPKIAKAVSEKLLPDFEGKSSHSFRPHHKNHPQTHSPRLSCLPSQNSNPISPSQDEKN
jgi:hypothetical protein